MLNQVVVVGNLGNDPQTLYSSDGQPITNFNMAFQASKQKTCWIRVVAFGNTANVVSQYLTKGSRIAVAGSLDQDKWVTEDGQHRSNYKLIAHSIEFIKVFKEGEESTGEEAPF